MNTIVKKPLSGSTLKALNTVRSSGGQVSDYALKLAGKIDTGEITTQQAVDARIAKALNR